MTAYVFEGDISIHTVHSPGTWLPNRDNLYLIIEIFNYCRRTRLVEAIFPLLIHEKFSFNKTFYSAESACKVAERLEDETVRIELRQITDVYCGGTLLAYFETTAKELFCPCPHMCFRTLPSNEMVMLRTVDFPGVSPRISFTVSSTIKCHPPQYYKEKDSTDYCKDCFYRRPLTSTPNYYRPTVNSVLRCRYSDLQEPKDYVSSDYANHIARRAHAQYSSFKGRRPKSTEDVSTNTNGENYRRGYSSVQPRRSPSSWDLRDRNLQDAQERCDRYWNLYRFWQNEADRRRGFLY
ncbi:unnamed protein product [Dicrocoelium dendriticum]|nr:unnamed protein product [Dicrocoelium dendriticum]